MVGGSDLEVAGARSRGRGPIQVQRTLLTRTVAFASGEREQCLRARRLAHAHHKSAFRDTHSHKCKQLPVFKQNPFIAKLGRSINNANRWAVVLYSRNLCKCYVINLRYYNNLKTLY